MVAKGNEVVFLYYYDNELWYSVTYRKDLEKDFDVFQFPVPISDISSAKFLATDKAILFMRYMRKHIDRLNRAKEDQYGK